MRKTYIDLMAKSLAAYSDKHIRTYFDDVKSNGLSEHGFARLTSNIGILITYGIRVDLLPVFLEMMEFCCKNIPTVKAANDFSVREIVCCLTALEGSRAVDNETLERWKSYLRTIEPASCYNKFARSPDDDVRNWALFTAVSEYFRLRAGLSGSLDFIELQIASQLKFFDENGMYMDHKGTDIHQPIMYDIVPRGLFSLLLHHGYRGKFYKTIDKILKKSALLTLKMQSANGEMAFGGRSNQFLHNEAWMAAIFEYEARRYAKEGNTALVYAFKSATAKALSVTSQWLDKQPIRHIKNRFPTETKYGCEKYAYFDKYMITTASNLYAAYLICDDTIFAKKSSDTVPNLFQTSKHFHKLFLTSRKYSLEFDTNADADYDACGLGRVHRNGAPSAICLSVPCPCHPKYKTDLDNPIALSLCPGIYENGSWFFATDPSVLYNIVRLSADEDSAFSEIVCRFPNGQCINTAYTVNGDDVSINATGENEIAYMLPAFCFDGETHSDIKINTAKNCLSVSYDGWTCRYTTNGSIIDLNRRAANRNGHYQAFAAIFQGTLDIKIEIEKA